MSAMGVQPAAMDIRTQFLDSMSRAAFCVNVVTTDGPAGRAGVTVWRYRRSLPTAALPTVLVNIHHQSKTATAVIDNGVFCINIMRDDQADIADHFGGRRQVRRRRQVCIWEMALR